MTVDQGTAAVLFGHDPRDYRPHPLHGPDRVYRETNCWTDVLIELVHAHGDEPLAAMGSLVRLDFEGDQWTFFKPAPADLEALLGIDVHEMQPYRELPVQIEEQVRAGRSVLFEVDSWFLPDAETYGREHVKTGIAVEMIDRAGERLRYFHGIGLHELSGADYRGVFRDGIAPGGPMLPPYVEIVRFDGEAVPPEERIAAARAALAGHLRRISDGNPFDRFGRRLADDLPDLLGGDIQRYHDYAFATVRMAGSGFEVLHAHVGWLLGHEGAAAQTALGRIVDGCKALSFKLARRRPFDPSPAIEGLAEAWDAGVTELRARV